MNEAENSKEHQEYLYDAFSGDLVNQITRMYKNRLEYHLAVEKIIKAFRTLGISLSKKEILDREPDELLFLADQCFGKRPKLEYRYEKQDILCRAGDVYRSTGMKDYRVLEVYSDKNLLLMDVDSGAMVVGTGVDFVRKLLKPTEQELAKAKELIERFWMRKYGKSADFSDCSDIRIVCKNDFADTGKERTTQIEVHIDLIRYELRIEVSDKTVALFQYNTMGDLIRYELDFMDLDEWVSLADEVLLGEKGGKEPEIAKEDIYIRCGREIYLSNIPSEIDFVALKREYGREPEPNAKGEFDIEIREVLSRTESVKAGFLGEAIDELMDKYKSGEIVLDAEDFKGVDYIPVQKKEGR